MIGTLVVVMLKPFGMGVWEDVEMKWDGADLVVSVNNNPSAPNPFPGKN